MTFASATSAAAATTTTTTTHDITNPTVLLRTLHTGQTRFDLHEPSSLSSHILHIQVNAYIFFYFGATAPPHPHWARASSFTRFLDHTQQHTTVGRTPLDEWSARRRDLCLTTHNTHTRQTFMPPAGFEPTISAGERPQTYTLDRAATGTGKHSI